MPHKTKRNNNKKRNGNKSTIMTNPDRSSFNSNHHVLPPCYRTKFMVNFSGSLPSGTAANGYFAVSGNSLHTPFNSTLSASIGTVNSFSASGYGGESYSTVQPAGFSTLCGTTQPYFAYRVVSSKIKVKFVPLNVQDTTLVNVGTVLKNQNATTTIWTATDCPNSSKTQQFSVYQKPTDVTNSRSTAEVHGIQPRAVRDELNFTALYNATPYYEWCWVINFQQVNNAVSTAIMGLSITVEYDVELLQPSTGDLPDTLSKSLYNSNLGSLRPTTGVSPVDSSSLSHSQDIITIGGKTYMAV
jgi:hypothetical protein